MNKQVEQWLEEVRLTEGEIENAIAIERDRFNDEWKVKKYNAECNELEAVAKAQLTKAKLYYDAEKEKEIQKEKDRNDANILAISKYKEQKEKEIGEILNKSVVTYRGATFWGATDYGCVELLMEKQTFEELEKHIGKIDGRIGKQYEGGQDEGIS